MRKSKSILLTVVSIPVILATGCGPSISAEGPVVSTVEQCVKASGNSATWCKMELAKAKAATEKDAPKFSSKSECETEFNECKQASSSSGGSSGFVPFVAGYALSSMLNNNNNGNYSNIAPVYSSKSGGMVTSKTYSSSISRGGFGGSSRSSFGG